MVSFSSVRGGAWVHSASQGIRTSPTIKCKWLCQLIPNQDYTAPQVFRRGRHEHPGCRQRFLGQPPQLGHPRQSLKAITARWDLGKYCAQPDRLTGESYWSVIIESENTESRSLTSSPNLAGTRPHFSKINCRLNQWKGSHSSGCEEHLPGNTFFRIACLRCYYYVNFLVVILAWWDPAFPSESADKNKLRYQSNINDIF